MADLKELAHHRSALLWFDPRILKIEEGLNGRNLQSPEIRDHIEWLASSIAEQGVLKPLEIFNRADGVYVSDGHCRLAATLIAIDRGAKIESVPCVPEMRGTNTVDRILNQNIANAGRPLTALEAGQNIKRALHMGWTIDQIAKKLGRSLSYIENALTLQEAPQEVKEAVQAGEISATLAQATLRSAGESASEVIRTGIAKAKECGKRKVTAKILNNSKDVPQKRVQTGKSDAEITVKRAGLGEISVTFGERSPIVLPKSAWKDILRELIQFLEDDQFNTGNRPSLYNCDVTT